MDMWKYFAIGHADHLFCNPLSEAKVDELIELLALPSGARVLDIACGKAEFLVRTAKRWQCEGVGVDLSPYYAPEAREKVARAGLASAVEIVEGDGKDYRGDAASFDAVICLGASWIWDGYEGTLRALSSWAKPGGLVISGEPYWRKKPSPEHLKAAEMNESTFGTHIGNVEKGLELGLDLLHTIVSNDDDWDHYEGYQWNAIERYARRNPDDPDVPELLSTLRKYRDHFLRWGRDEFGWAVYVFATPGRPTASSS